MTSEGWRVRWDRDGIEGEHGTVTVTHRDGDVTDIYTLAAHDRTRGRYHREKSGRAQEYGGGAEHVEDGGPVAGLVLSLVYRRRLVHGKQTDPEQDLPPRVAEHLVDRGAAEIGPPDE